MVNFDVKDKNVLIAGGSRGLGKALGLELAAKGAYVVLLARGKEGLDIARAEIMAVRKAETRVDILCADLTKPEEVREVLVGYESVPDILFCVAGGSTTQMGFLADISPEALISCLEINYYAAIFIAQQVMKLWVQSPASSCTRHIIFISSTAASVSIPGYIAYTPTKVAIRTFADTLRQELLLYGNKDVYQVHCAFPGTFISEAFLEEQALKPELTKIMDGSNVATEKLKETTESADSVARKVLRGLDRGEFFVTTDLEGALLLNNMRGPSPRDHTLFDLLLSFVAVIVWPIVRRNFDSTTLKYGRTHQYGKGR